jgi:hypothetical protein
MKTANDYGGISYLAARPCSNRRQRPGKDW